VTTDEEKIRMLASIQRAEMDLGCKLLVWGDCLIGE
jgi:hypothetical protein